MNPTKGEIVLMVISEIKQHLLRIQWILSVKAAVGKKKI